MNRFAELLHQIGQADARGSVRPAAEACAVNPSLAQDNKVSRIDNAVAVEVGEWP